MKKLLLIYVIALFVGIGANAQSQSTTNSQFGQDVSGSAKVAHDHDRIVIGRVKDPTSTSVRCVRRKHSCGFSVVTPGGNGSPAVLSYIFPLDFTGPFPPGTYINDKGMHQRDNVEIKSEIKNGESGQTIFFK